MLKFLLRTVLRIVEYFCGSLTCQKRVTQPSFVITVICLVYIGVTEVLPALYIQWAHPAVIPYFQWFTCYIGFQLLVNWLCIKFVQSGYDPAIHGAEQPNYNKRYPSNTVSVDLGFGSDSNRTQRIVTSYVSWSYCIRCNKPRPPRCHHCPLCQTCILKRDHHCFITNVCIGYRNLRHFLVFLFWTSVGAIFGSCHMVPYYVTHVVPKTPLVTSHPFGGAYNMTSLGQDLKWIFLTVLALSLIFFSFWSFYYFRKMIGLLLSGKTSFEHDANMKIKDDREWLAKFKSVFGYYWVLNFFIPLHFVYEPLDDPAYWPYLT